MAAAPGRTPRTGVGSFLNVCIYRLPIEQSLAYPPSRCMSCNRRLRWFENIPVFAWVALGGKCRTCRTPIPAVYPLVEAFTGAMFVLGGVALRARVAALLAAAARVRADRPVLHRSPPPDPAECHHGPRDRHRVHPELRRPAGLGVLAHRASARRPDPAGARRRLYLRIRKIEGLGMGDVKMLALIGAFLGWKLMLLTLALGSFLGSFVGHRAHRGAEGRHEVRAAVRHVPCDSRHGRGGCWRFCDRLVRRALLVGARGATGVRSGPTRMWRAPCPFAYPQVAHQVPALPREHGCLEVELPALQRGDSVAGSRRAPGRDSAPSSRDLDSRVRRWRHRRRRLREFAHARDGDHRAEPREPTPHGPRPETVPAVQAGTRTSRRAGPTCHAWGRRPETTNPEPACFALTILKPG